MSKKESKAGEKLIASNRKAGFNYFLMEKFEAGLVLLGTEVKSCREGGASLSDSYCTMNHGELWLVNAHIGPYGHAGPMMNHAPRRERKLLLHKRQIGKLDSQLREKGLTIVPVRMYFKEGRAKLEIALAKGKKSYDKRDTIRKRDNDRDMARALRSR